MRRSPSSGRFPDARFELIVARDLSAHALAARARRSGVARRVHVRRRALDECAGASLAATDIFVLPSRSESFPNAVLEAMAAGLPIVASGVGGILELIEDGRTGWLVPLGQDDAAAPTV